MSSSDDEVGPALPPEMMAERQSRRPLEQEEKQKQEERREPRRIVGPSLDDFLPSSSSGPSLPSFPGRHDEEDDEDDYGEVVGPLPPPSDQGQESDDEDKEWSRLRSAAPPDEPKGPQHEEWMTMAWEKRELTTTERLNVLYSSAKGGQKPQLGYGGEKISSISKRPVLNDPTSSAPSLLSLHQQNIKEKEKEERERERQERKERKRERRERKKEGKRREDERKTTKKSTAFSWDRDRDMAVSSGSTPSKSSALIQDSIKHYRGRFTR